MATLDEYFAARDRRDGANGHLSRISRRLRELADTLENPNGVRLNKPTVYRGSPPNHAIVDKDSWMPWEQVEAAIEAFVKADSEFRQVEDGLTPDQRRQTRG